MFAYTGGLKGDAGAAGEQGEQGEQGIQGIQGEQGVQGDGMVFVDMGNSAAVDFDKNDLTTDGNWNQLDLSGKIPATARLVKIRVYLSPSAGASVVLICKNGHSNRINVDGMHVEVATGYVYRTCDVAIGADGLLEYNITDTAYSNCDFTIMGYFRI